MTAPTTLPDALAEIEELRGQVRDLLQLLGQEAKPSATGVNASPVKTTDAHEFSEGLVPKQNGKDAAQHLLNLHQMIETVPDIIFTLDLQGNLVGWNKRLQIVTGFTSQELNGRPALSFVPDHEHAQTAAAIQRAFEDGYAELEGHLLTKAQLMIPYHWTGAALKNEEGRVIGITGVGRDVSEKRRIQAELKRQRQQLLSAQALAHVGSWEWDISSGDMEWSEEQFRIFGHEPGAIPTTYEAILTAVLPDDHDRVTTEISTALKGQEPLDIECRIVRPSGEIRSIHCRGEIIGGGAGHPTRVSGSTLDITDRKQGELALQRSEAHFRALIEHSSDIITVLDLDGTIRFESPSFERLLGFAQHEIDGLIAFDFIHPDDLQTVLEKFQLVVQRPGEAQTAEFRFRHKDGSWLALEGIGRSILDTEGQRCVIVNSRDVTERTRSEAALIRSHGLLTSFVEHTPAAVAMLDKDLRYVAVSRRWLQDYRLGDQNLIGRFHYDVFPEIRELEEWQAIHRRCLDGAVERREEDRFIRADGSEDWLRWEVRPWHDVIGTIGGIIMFTEVITERKRTEAALRISQERYARATAIGKVGIWELDAVTGLYHGDLNLKALFGYEPDELSTDPYVWLGLVHPEDQSIALKAWEGIVSGSTDDYHYELRMIRKNGTIIWTDVRGHAERDKHGHVQRLIGATVDITERKQADTALRISQMKLRQAIEASNTGLWDWNTATNEMMFSPEWKRQLGYGAEEISDRFEEWESRLHPDDKERVLAYASSYRNKPTGDYVQEFRLRHKDGSYRWVAAHASFVTEPNGRRVRLLGSHTDITDRKRAERALRESEELFAKAFRGSPNPVVISEAETSRCLEVNEAFLQLFGFSRQEVIGNTTLMLGIWTEPEMRTQLLRRLQAGEPVRNVELGFKTKTGELRHFLTSSDLIELNGTICLITVGSDITERKRAEETLGLTQFSVDRAVDGVFWVAPDGRILSVNEAACRMLEYSREELAAMTVHDIEPQFPPESWPGHWEELKQKGSMTFESKHWSSTGRVLDTEVTVNYLRYGGNEYNCAIMRDIGERKRVEAELRRSHTFLRQVIDTTPNFIFAKDRDGRFTLVNKALADAYGTTVDNLFGKTEADFNPNRDEVAFFAKKDLEVLDSLQERFIPEEKITDATGQIRWLQTVKRPLLDDTGRATMVLGASTDITARKGVELALRRRESDLQAAMAERERISEDLHDGILQSIYAIGLGLEACKPLIADQPKRSAVKLKTELQRTIGQLNHVLEEVRNFIAGLESHILDGQEFDMVLRTMGHALAASYSVPCRVTVEKAAAQQLSTEQAYHVMNVAREALSNSCRHSHARRITLSLKRLSRSVRLSVIDNGVGFNPSAVRDTGHGLANMASRASKIGGTFTLLSKPRGGTKVVLDLPMRCTDANG